MRATQIGDITFAHIQAFVDDIITVSEEEIKKTMRLLLNTGLVSEPSGVVSVAAFLFKHAILPKHALTVAVISGGNIAPNQLIELLK